MKTRLVSSVLIFGVLLGGCVVVPNVDEPFTEEAVEIAVGTTTRTQVFELLGEPTAAYFDETEYLYAAEDWAYWAAIFFASGHTGSFDAGKADREYFLWLRFDEEDVVQDVALEETFVGHGPRDFPSVLAAELDEEPESIVLVRKAGWTASDDCSKANIPGTIVYGSDYIGTVKWGANKFLTRKYQFNEALEAHIDSWSFGIKCVVIEMETREFLTFILHTERVEVFGLSIDNKAMKTIIESINQTRANRF